MSPIVAFILGLLVGWLVEWIIDWLYWRKRFAALQAELDLMKNSTASGEKVDAGMEGQLAIMADLASLQQANAGLEADCTALNQQLLALKQEKLPLVEQLEACKGKLSAPQASPAVEAPGEAIGTPAPQVSLTKDAPTVRLTKPVAVVPDDLTIIKGIGPVINRRLNQGGITTFEQLAALTPARLVEIVGDMIQRLADEDVIIEQARELAAKKTGGG